ncbi:MAG: twin-arginine translocase subunit TatB, partial [Burkholderiales bacterium]|nr:twin-arginine translocase subunit TatB [Burkholderiales bacterium]
MFDIGIWELALIGLLALIVLGPNRLPEVARTAGKWVGNLRRFVASVKEDFDQELRTEELGELRKLQQELSETRQLIQRSSSDALERLQRDIDAESAANTAADAAEPQRERLPPKVKTKRARATRTRKSSKPAASTTRAKKMTSRKKQG